MTRRTRRYIFYTLLLLFILLGGGVAFYAYGWRLDFRTFHLEKVGGIYVRAYPEYAAISLNGKPIHNQSGFLNTGTLISNLLPQTYELTLHSDGFDNWHENANVAPSLVTQFKTAVLVPSASIPASSSDRDALSFTTPTSTLNNPFDNDQKIIFGKNKISVFAINEATTTIAVALTAKPTAAQWIASNLIGILQSDGQCLLYDTSNEKITHVANNVITFSATQDGSFIATLEQRSLEVFAIDGSNNYYRFNVPNLAAAQKLIWYKDNAHLFIVYPDSVLFLDLQDIDLVNITLIGQGTSPIYDPQANVLYLTNNSGKLVKYVFPN